MHPWLMKIGNFSVSLVSHKIIFKQCNLFAFEIVWKYPNLLAVVRVLKIFFLISSHFDWGMIFLAKFTLKCLKVWRTNRSKISQFWLSTYWQLFSGYPLLVRLFQMFVKCYGNPHYVFYKWKLQQPRANLKKTLKSLNSATQ